jgi:ubiquinone/menaquinone biosynthesis C-methylase UbiE
MPYNWDYLDEKAYNNKVGNYKYRREFKFIVENGNSHFEKILDIAGGSGRFAMPLSQYSATIHVLDINQEALQLINERNNSIETIHSDFIDAEIIDTFSLILCIEALGSFEDWELFFNKVHMLLSDNGRFVFTYTNPTSWRFYLRKLKHWKNGFHPYKEMELDELKKTLIKCNFEIDKMEGMNWIPLPLSSNSIFVSFFEKIEQFFKLKNWHSQSPWLLFSVKHKLNTN